MTKRKSVTLSKTVKGDILHSFFRDVSKEAQAELEQVEQTAALKIYDIIYGGIAQAVEAVPDSMLCLYSGIPMPAVTLKVKKAPRKKGSIEPTQTERLVFRTFASGMTMDRSCVTRTVDELTLPAAMPQYNGQGGNRWPQTYISSLLEKKLISKADAKKIQDVYIKACHHAETIYAPIVAIVEGVIEILQNVKSTKGLFDMWPECDKYLDLPQESRGELMKVDVVELNKALDGLYPPAEKTSGA